jgi:hypothetical protein
MKRESVNDPNVFAGERIGTIKAALLRRLESAGYFAVETSPTREFYASSLAPIQTINECREHVEEVERLATKYRRTPPTTMKAAAHAGYQVTEVVSRPLGDGIAKSRGLALLQEKTGLKRTFVVPFTARHSFGKPRTAKYDECLLF